MQQEFKEKPEKFEKEPIRGWLLVMLIDIIIMATNKLYGIVVFGAGEYAQYSRYYYPGAYQYDLAFIGLSLIALYLIHKRKRSVVPFLIMYYAILLIEGLMSGSIHSSVNIQVSSIIWIIYLMKSVRVKRTFTQ